MINDTNSEKLYFTQSITRVYWNKKISDLFHMFTQFYTFHRHILTLIWVGWDNFTLCWFSLNNSEMLKWWNHDILQHFVRDIYAKFGIPNLPQSPDIGQNPDKGISNFWISGRSLIKVNCHNCRTSDDIDIKFGPVTKLDKRSKTTSENVYRQIVTSLSLFQFMANLEQSGSQALAK